MGTQADRWEVRGSWCWFDSQRVAGTGTMFGSAIAALLDEVRGPVLPDGVKPGYVLEPGTVLPDGWQPRGPFFVGRGPYTFPTPVEPIPAPATEEIDTLTAHGRLLPDGRRIAGVGMNGYGKWWHSGGLRTYAPTVEVQVES